MPDLETVEQLLINLHRQGDREAAIVGASLVESALQERLVKSFDSVAEGLERSLFEDRGPLSDFNSKILVAQAFAVVPDRLADDMQRIRKIRNCFAHARVAVNFNEPLVSKEVFELAAVMAVQKSMELHPKDYAPNQPYKDPKTSYGLSCYLTYVMLKSEDLAAIMKKTTSQSPTDPSGH